jgi:hypothetical protein
MIPKLFTILIHCFPLYLQTKERKVLFRVTNKMPLLNSENSGKINLMKEQITLPKAVVEGETQGKTVFK